MAKIHGTWVLGFKRAVLLMFAMFCFQGHALAASLDANGRGQVLLFPFVTSQEGWDTYLGLNLGPPGHIVRLRFLDPVDGKELHTFNVYSNFGENWRAAVTHEESGPVLRIGEGSCTVSDSGSFGGVGTDFDLDFPLMMVEAYSFSSYLDDSLMQLSCADIAARWETGGIWRTDPEDGLTTSGSSRSLTISGYFDLVNVQRGLSSAENATALMDFASELSHSAPDDGEPNLGSADPISILPNGDEYQFTTGIDAIARLLSVGFFKSVANDVITAKSIAASTDWIVTFPLSGYQIYGLDTAIIDGETRRCSSSGLVTESEPSIEQAEYFPWTYQGTGVSVSGGGSAIGTVPTRRYLPFLCYAVNTLTFGDATPIFQTDGSVHNFRLSGIEGSMDDVVYWVSYEFRDGGVLPNDIYRPLIGFRATTYVNGTLNGGAVLANYMAIRKHDLR